MDIYMIALLIIDICGAIVDLKIFIDSGNKFMIIPAAMFIVAAIGCLLVLMI